MMQHVNNISSTPSGFSSIISLNNLILSVNLGVTEDERKTPQKISVSFKFYMKGIPKSCETDNIEDTVCYAEMAELVKQHCSKKDFKLLEYLCYFLYEEIRKKIDPEVKIWVGVEKCDPPIEGLVGSTSFEYTDI